MKKIFLIILNLLILGGAVIGGMALTKSFEEKHYSSFTVEYQNNIDELNTLINSLRNDILSLENEKEQLLSVKEKLQLQYDELIKTNSKNESEISTLKEQLSALSSQIEKLDELQNQYNQLEENYTNLNSQYQLLLEQSKNDKEKIKELDEKYKDYNSKYYSLLGQYNSLIMEKSSLESQLDFFKKENEDLKNNQLFTCSPSISVESKVESGGLYFNTYSVVCTTSEMNKLQKIFECSSLRIRLIFYNENYSEMNFSENNYSFIKDNHIEWEHFNLPAGLLNGHTYYFKFAIFHDVDTNFMNPQIYISKACSFIFESGSVYKLSFKISTQ